MTAEAASSVFVGLPLLLVVLVLIALTIALPVFVAQISSRMWKLLQESKAQSKTLSDLSQHIQRFTAATVGNSSEVAERLEINNQLLRQLLRAYGHEPES
jgi:DNA-binding NtrC family response regulator